MLHQKLSMTPLEAVAKMAKNAMQSARESKTAQNGSYAWENADGTKTFVGVISGTDDTDTQRGFVQWVGDTEAPGTPTGVTARCSGGGTLIVSWDGTLDGGVPSDFDHISIVVDGTSRGRLVKAGSLAISGLSVGTHSVSAIAYDAARLDDGSLAPNASTASTAVSVEITNESAEAKTLAEQAEAVATATGQHFWSDTDGAHVTEAERDDWETAHTGPNSLWNSLGMLFRDGLNNLLTLTMGATYTETFQIRRDEDYYYELTYEPMVVESVTINNVATNDYTWTNSGHVEGSGKLGTLILGYDTWYSHNGATLSVTYRTSPAMTIYDGLANLAANVMSYFTATEIGLGGNIYGDEHGTSRSAAVRFFGASDGQGASLTSGTVRESGDDFISYEDDIGLAGRTTDSDAVTVNGCISDYGVSAKGYLYDDSESSDDYQVESTAYLHARSRSSDSYDAADAIAALGVKTVTVGDDYARSYVTLNDNGVTDKEISVKQSIVGLGQPVSTFTGSNSTATASAAGWQLTWFNTSVSGTSNVPWSDYYTFNNGVITTRRACVLEISGVMCWTDTIAGNRGFGVFVGSTTVSSGTEHSSFTSFPSGGSNRRSVVFPPKLFPCAAGTNLAIGRYQQQSAVYQNGTNFSWITIRVVEDRSI